MSHALYATRLYWWGGRGIAKLRGTSVPLAAPPHLHCLRVEGIDYVPEVHIYRVLPERSGWRDLTAEEISAADALLREMTTPAP